MNRDLSSYHPLSGPFNGRLEASWLELRELTTVCAAEGLVDQKLLHYELEELKRKMDEARSRNDPTQLELCLEQCQSLLAYYGALRKQTKGAPETASALLGQEQKPQREGCGKA